MRIITINVTLFVLTTYLKVRASAASDQQCVPSEDHAPIVQQIRHTALVTSQ